MTEADIPEQLPANIRIVVCDLIDGNRAVKIALTNGDGQQLYAIYSQAGKYQHEVCTLDELKKRETLSPD